MDIRLKELLDRLVAPGRPGDALSASEFHELVELSYEADKKRVLQGGDLTFDQLVQACANIGYDLTCGQCAAVFYTGSGTYAHHPHCATAKGAPVPMLLWCPSCGTRHVDAGEFATKVHHTHACQRCGCVWRPAIGPTVGVQFLPGFKDTPDGDESDARMRLWMHLVSRHAGIYNPKMTLEELRAEHDHEHKGPGTIRHHPQSDLGYSLKKLGKVLSEADDGEEP